MEHLPEDLAASRRLLNERSLKRELEREQAAATAGALGGAVGIARRGGEEDVVDEIEAELDALEASEEEDEEDAEDERTLRLKPVFVRKYSLFHYYLLLLTSLIIYSQFYFHLQFFGILFSKRS